MRTRTFVLAGIFAALLIAGVGSYWASTHPDGLQHVAEQAGFAGNARDSATQDSPLSGYRVKGVENPAVSRGLAGVVGALVVLAFAVGLTYAVRRKGQSGADPAADPSRNVAEDADGTAGGAPRDAAGPVTHRPGPEGR